MVKRGKSSKVRKFKVGSRRARYGARWSQLTDFYKIFGKEQLSTAQSSSLGIPLGPLSVSGIGQADDTALAANSIHDLLNLLHHTSVFCSKYQVQLVL